MKKYILVFISITVLLTSLCFFAKSETAKKYWNAYLKHSDYMECVEDGICREGVINGSGENQYVINKDTCLEHNGKWNGIACDFRQ